MISDPVTVLSNFTLDEGLRVLREAGFGLHVLERGTICAYKGQRCYGFPPRYGRFSKEAITRAIEDNA